MGTHPIFESDFDCLTEIKEMNGLLYKYTNFAKGWQRRFFVLEGSTLNYYLREPTQSGANTTKKSRGSLPIIGAHITPSDEDGLGFTVSAPNEVVYKLKAADARGRQRWVDYLRAAAAGDSLEAPESMTDVSLGNSSGGGTGDGNGAFHAKSKVTDQLSAARESLTAARQYQAQLEDYADERPINVDLLKVIAFARAAVRTLEMAVETADRTVWDRKKTLTTSTTRLEAHSSSSTLRQKDNSSSSDDDDEEDEDDDNDDEWMAASNEADTILEEYSDEQRANIVSLMQSIPFGGDLFDHKWPGWLESRESGAMKLGRLCMHCPDTTDPIQFAKWFLFIVDLKNFLANRVPAPSPPTIRVKSGAIVARIDIGEDGTYKCEIENGMRLAFSISFASPYRGPGKPYAIKISMSDIEIGRQTWRCQSTPEIRVAHPLSTPTLTWSGKWRLVCDSDGQCTELELAYDATGGVSGQFKCGTHQEYNIVTKDQTVYIDDDKVEFKRMNVYVC